MEIDVRRLAHLQDVDRPAPPEPAQQQRRPEEKHEVLAHVSDRRVQRVGAFEKGEVPDLAIQLVLLAGLGDNRDSVAVRKQVAQLLAEPGVGVRRKVFTTTATCARRRTAASSLESGDLDVHA
ncbi:MAG: hypothetical protein ACJ74F_23330 [Mycobacterium sp.]|uniref:hypothetical protein n=1 Tax=Mycobacterium sp. TaxID=1785 RepID=UPI00389AF61E